MASSISSLVGSPLEEFLPLLALILLPDPKRFDCLLNVLFISLLSARTISGVAGYVKEKIKIDELKINKILVTNLQLCLLIQYFRSVYLKLFNNFSHSKGSKFFFRLLQDLQQGTKFDFILRPPRARGTT